MKHFSEAVGCEASHELVYQTNQALHRLLKGAFFFDPFLVTFHQPTNFFFTGLVDFKSEKDLQYNAVYNVYICREEVYATLSTLDMVKLIDSPFRSYLQSLWAYVSNDDLSVLIL